MGERMRSQPEVMSQQYWTILCPGVGGGVRACRPLGGIHPNPILGDLNRGVTNHVTSPGGVMEIGLKKERRRGSQKGAGGVGGSYWLSTA